MKDDRANQGSGQLALWDSLEESLPVSRLAACALGTGSTGNAYIVTDGESTILVDCGLGIRDLEKRMELVGLSSSEITAGLITHGHDDHVKGMARAAAGRFPIWATERTYEAALAKAPVLKNPLPALEWKSLPTRKTFTIGSIEITAHPVPHDWPGTYAFVFCDGAGRKIGIATDVGWAEEKLVSALSDCDLLFFEFNHDADLLRIGPYPPSLIARVAGPGGHLSNEEASETLGKLIGPDTKRLVAVHLSRTNNRPHLVEESLAEGLEKLGSKIPAVISMHDRPTALFAAAG